MADRIAAVLLRRGGANGEAGSVLFACPRCGKQARYSERSGRWRCLDCQAGGDGADLVGGSATAPSPTPIRRPATISAADLARKEFDEPRWAVSGVIPEGLTLLVGPSKRGKSWLMLAACLAIASGGVALGSVPVEAGDVLYLALEDNQRRLQERQRVLSAGDPLPPRLEFATEWPRQSEGGAEAIDLWLADHPAARLVVVDVLARFRAHVAGNANAYQADYDAVSTLKTVADRRGVAVVVVHHTRKMGADDPVDTISGTTGLAGAADTLLILQREKSRADAVLYVRGRDVPEAEHALVFDSATCLWTIAGDAAEFRLSAERAAVLDVLRQSAEPMTPKQIAEALGKRDGAIRVLVRRMAMNGEVVGVAGQYTAPPLPGGEVVAPRELGQPSEPSGPAPPAEPRTEPLRFDDAEIVLHSPMALEARRRVRRAVVSPAGLYRVFGEPDEQRMCRLRDSTAVRVAYLATGMRSWLQEIAYPERILYVTIERGSEVLYDSRSDAPIDEQLWAQLSARAEASPISFETKFMGEHEPPRFDASADVHPLSEPAWAALPFRSESIDGGEATIVDHSALFGERRWAVRKFSVQPPTPDGSRSLCVRIKYVKPRHRNSEFAYIAPTHADYTTVEVGGQVVYDSRSDIACDMEMWAALRCEFQDRFRISDSAAGRES